MRRWKVRGDGGGWCGEMVVVSWWRDGMGIIFVQRCWVVKSCWVFEVLAAAVEGLQEGNTYNGCCR